MATIKQIRRVVNPAGGSRRRRRLSAKQKLYFGSARQRASARRAPAKSTRRRRSVRASKNPIPLLVTLGAVNPRGGNSTMAKRRRKTTSSRRRRSTVTRRRRRSNPKIVVLRSTRRRRRASAPSRRRGRRRNYRRNPAAFGQKIPSGKFMQAVLGGLVGVAATKFIPTLIPSNFTAGGGNVMRFVVSVGSAIVAGMIGQKIAPGGFGDGVMFGGLMQAASVGMNAFLPPSAGFLALNGGRGMGDFVGSRFVVPQNPIAGYVAPAAPRVGVSGVNRAFSNAF